jgi:hypothetical protein
MHDGVTAYWSRAVWNVLCNTYHDRWIGRGGPTVWPPHSPDLNPLDFYLWGHLETLVYAAAVDNEETTRSHCGCLSDYPQLPRHLRTDAAVHYESVQACIETHGGHFGHLLYMYSFSCKSQIKCFWTHVDANIFLVLVRATRVESLSVTFSYILHTELSSYYKGRGSERTESHASL